VRRATIRDVAEATGLSPASVSYALRGARTSQATQERVRTAAAALGYRAHPVARALASGRTGLVGVLSGSLEDLGEQAFVQALGRHLSGHGLHMLVTDAGGDPARERQLALQLGERWVDGLIVSPLDPSAPGWAELAAALPVVSVGDPLPGATAGAVVYDNRRGVTLVLEHLHALGHRRIAVLTPSRPSTPERPAEIVVGEVAGALGLDPIVVNSPHSVDGARAVAARALADPPRPTAVFCLSDSIAAGVYVAAAEQGLGVGAELAVAGYDDHPIARALSPALTSVAWDAPAVAARAAAMLAAAIEARPHVTSQERIAPRLIVRASACHPAASPAAS
jgi:LacI family transcriptional regulator